MSMRCLIVAWMRSALPWLLGWGSIAFCKKTVDFARRWDFTLWAWNRCVSSTFMLFWVTKASCRSCNMNWRSAKVQVQVWMWRWCGRWWLMRPKSILVSASWHTSSWRFWVWALQPFGARCLSTFRQLQGVLDFCSVILLVSQMSFCYCLIRVHGSGIKFSFSPSAITSTWWYFLCSAWLCAGQQPGRCYRVTKRFDARPIACTWAQSFHFWDLDGAIWTCVSWPRKPLCKKLLMIMLVVFVVFPSPFWHAILPCKCLLSCCSVAWLDRKVGSGRWRHFASSHTSRTLAWHHSELPFQEESMHKPQSALYLSLGNIVPSRFGLLKVILCLSPY